MLELFWWGSVFLLAVPVMALLLVLGPRVLPEYRDPNAGRLDLVSALMSLVAVLSAVFGLKLLAQDGLGALAVSAVVVGLVVAVAFAHRQLRLADPMIDLQLFRIGRSTPRWPPTWRHLHRRRLLPVRGPVPAAGAGLSPLEAACGRCRRPSGSSSLEPGPPGAAPVRPAVVTAPGWPWPRRPGVLTQVGRSTDADLAILAGASLVISLGLAPVFTTTTDLIVGSAPPERAGAASGISETGAELGGALGIAILGSIGVAIYRGRLVDALPAGIPAEAAATARETLGAAVGIATQLPAETGAALLAAARDAFTFGLQLTAGLSAVVAAAMAVAATILLRAVPVTAQAEPAEQPPTPAEPAPTSFEDSFQLIRSGSGCVACPPGDRGHADPKSAER